MVRTSAIISYNLLNLWKAIGGILMPSTEEISGFQTRFKKLQEEYKDCVSHIILSTVQDIGVYYPSK